jgi:hypothetical protein
VGNKLTTSEADPANDAERQGAKALLALTSRAEKGDVTALPEIRELLRSPAAVDLLGGDLARLAQQTLIIKFCSDNLLVKEALIRKLDLLREELGGANPSPLERLLVDRVATCWLLLHHFEMLYAQRDSMSLELSEYYQQSIDRAQKRYLGAIKTLAMVRKLAVPVLQVNIAKKQVNVAGTCVTADGAAPGTKELTALKKDREED